MVPFCTSLIGEWRKFTKKALFIEHNLIVEELFCRYCLNWWIWVAREMISFLFYHVWIGFCGWHSLNDISYRHHARLMFIDLNGLDEREIEIAGLGSSVGRALDWRSKGPWFDPGSGHYPDISGGRHFFFTFLLFVSFDKMKVFLVEMFINLNELIIFKSIVIILDMNRF